MKFNFKNRKFEDYNSSHFWIHEPDAQECQTFLKEEYETARNSNKSEDEIAGLILTLNMNNKQYAAWPAAFKAFLNEHPSIKQHQEKAKSWLYTGLV